MNFNKKYLKNPRCYGLSENSILYIRKTIKWQFFKGDFTTDKNVYFFIFCIDIHDKDFDKGKIGILGNGVRENFEINFDGVKREVRVGGWVVCGFNYLYPSHHPKWGSKWKSTPLYIPESLVAQGLHALLYFTT